ncbi:hypothetical protein K525DRAFT_187069 [Schizophyllum commune Loenen D]|nr:hypothetical protein K525DRAFT_187069 [Schizophyllum commune Loenen D]
MSALLSAWNIGRTQLLLRNHQDISSRCRRWLSTTTLHPSISGFATRLCEKQPVFAVPPSKIQVLSQPKDFYALLLNMIQHAERRVFLSSLYIGSDEKELVPSLKDALHKKPLLHVYLQLDLNRSTRPGASTAQLLQPLLEQYPERVHVSLFRSPHLRGVLAKVVPPRFNEGWGTWHAKVYGADDDVMISGANLNKSYFTDRQDRYIHFSAQPHVAEYCFDFLQTVASFSFKLLPRSSTIRTSEHPHSIGDSLLWPDASTHPHHIHHKAQLALTTLQETYRHRPVASDDSTPQVLIFPVIQAGQFGVREEENALALLFKHLQIYGGESGQRPLVDLTSGYFGLYRPYQELILASKNVDTSIIAASPKANGFYGSSGISGRIPEGYTLLEQRFMRAVRQAGRQADVRLHEWHREGWTYHAKGIWVSPSPTEPPVLTLFGSTNLNSRSAHIDTELSFIMVIPSDGDASASQRPPESASHRPSESSSQWPTESALSEQPDELMALRRRLAEEVRDLRAHAGPWQGDKRHVRIGTKAIVGVVGGML